MSRRDPHIIIGSWEGRCGRQVVETTSILMAVATLYYSDKSERVRGDISKHAYIAPPRVKSMAVLAHYPMARKYPAASDSTRNNAVVVFYPDDERSESALVYDIVFPMLIFARFSI